jgi:hypothetical protein
MGMRNFKGYSTIELLISLGLLVAVSLSAATLTQIANRSSSYADSKLEAQALGNLFIEHLKNASSCGNALGSGSGLSNRAFGGNGDIRNTYNTGAHVQLRIPRLQAGPSMSSDTINPDAPNAEDRQILARKMQVNGIRLAEGLQVDADASSFTFMANVYLDAQPLDGMSLRPQHIGTVNVVTDTAGTITSCQSQAPTVASEICSQMGCTFDAAQTPPCRCTVSFQYCFPISRYPIRFEGGRPHCEPLGSGEPCPANQYLTAVGIGHQVCAPAPSTCPAGTSTSGAGGAVPGLISCKCPNAGQSFTGGACNPPATPTPDPSTPAPTPGPSAPPVAGGCTPPPGGCCAGHPMMWSGPGNLVCIEADGDPTPMTQGQVLSTDVAICSLSSSGNCHGTMYYRCDPSGSGNIQQSYSGPEGTTVCDEGMEN